MLGAGINCGAWSLLADMLKQGSVLITIGGLTGVLVSQGVPEGSLLGVPHMDGFRHSYAVPRPPRLSGLQVALAS